LYKLRKEKYPELKEDLVLTGCHSILVSTLKDKEREEIRNKMGRIFETDYRYRLPAFVDERSDVYKDERGDITVYHIALGDDEKRNYGIYANGLLVESCFICTVKRKMTLI
jgi:hypothetical protein